MIASRDKLLRTTALSRVPLKRPHPVADRANVEAFVAAFLRALNKVEQPTPRRLTNVRHRDHMTHP